ncbi:Valine--pyruvate aminotransferase [Lithohypha guttulata]|uniref:Valine--pyruvate aminotransferase n=1 Tax=Lithohypha guttulata TaxID=1690604 RepID=A0AAN7T7L5_9EURO|nr:Valine--pyruvate aminotransferase [Lithohypha guttulata]
MSTEQKPIDLLAGWPNPGLLPPTRLETAAHDVLQDPYLAKQSLRYGPDEGYHPLIEEIARWLTRFYCPKDAIGPERICITGGASQNLGCALQVFTDPVYTRNVWMVAPTYFRACPIIDDNGFGGRIKGVPEGEEGIDIDYLRTHIAKSEEDAVRNGNTEPKMKTLYSWRKIYKHVIYAVPTFANPSGCLMSLARREQLWSSKISGPARNRFQARYPRLVDIDRYLDGGPVSEWGNTMSNGSFSKIIAPGCRTGWAEATPKLAWGLSQCGSSRSGGAPSQLVASMVHQMLTSGSFEEHLRGTLLPSYEKRYRRLMQSIQARLVPLGVTLPKLHEDTAGGYFIWLTLPSGLNAEEIRTAALEEENLTIMAGWQCQVQGDDESGLDLSRNLRLSFAWEDFDALDDGVQRLAKVIGSKVTR